MDHKYKLKANWIPREGSQVVCLDLEETKHSTYYRDYVGLVGTVEYVKPHSNSLGHLIVKVVFEGYIYGVEMYSWRLAPYEEKPDWEV